MNYPDITKIKQIKTSACRTSYDVDGLIIGLWIITGGTPAIEFEEDITFSQRFPIKDEKWTNKNWNDEIIRYIHQIGKKIQGPTYDVLPNGLKDIEKFIHKNRYEYDYVDYKRCDIKIKIKCKIHGIFFQTPASHLSGKGCPLCLESQGELKIAEFLDSEKIKYEREKTFKDCRHKHNLFFDFYIPDFNISIEYDGKQHFGPVDYYGGFPSYNYLKKTDAIKNNYCLTNGIKLIRIPYTKKSRNEPEASA
jgi:hypothetical protein